jgi:hypothetical protein
MTLPERLYTRPSNIHPAPMRSTARNAGVCFNSDEGLHNAHSTLPNHPDFVPETKFAAPEPIAL